MLKCTTSGTPSSSSGFHFTPEFLKMKKEKRKGHVSAKQMFECIFKRINGMYSHFLEVFFLKVQILLLFHVQIKTFLSEVTSFFYIGVQGFDL